MKILLAITRGDTAGGAQTHARDLAEGLSRSGHLVLAVTGAGGPLTEALAAVGIDSIVCPEMLREIHPVRDVKAVRRLRQIIRAFDPDLICAHSSKAGMIARIAAKTTGVPCVFTAHGWSYAEGVPQPKRAVYRTIERVFAPLASKIICVSEQDRNLAIRSGIAAHRLVAIHNGMPDVPARLIANPGVAGPVRIVMVARFAPPKDQRALIDAIRDFDGIRLELVGDGPDLEAARQFAAEAGVSHRVDFLGQRHDVAEILAGAHIFALFTTWEGFPISTLEAMRAGLPVVASDVGGMAEAVIDGESGFLVPRGDVAAFRSSLQKLIDDPSRRAIMGNAARRRFEAEFTFDRMFARTLDVYHGILGVETSLVGHAREASGVARQASNTAFDVRHTAIEARRQNVMGSAPRGHRSGT